MCSRFNFGNMSDKELVWMYHVLNTPNLEIRGVVGRHTDSQKFCKLSQQVDTIAIFLEVSEECSRRNIDVQHYLKTVHSAPSVFDIVSGDMVG